MPEQSTYKRSTEVNDLINGKPDWLVRNAVIIFFLVVFALCAAAYLIKYPDIITTDATIFRAEASTSENASYFCEAQVVNISPLTLRPGQEVLLKLAAYPYSEFGSIKGRIEMISKNHADNRYLIKISLPNGLLTDNNKKLFYTIGMKAEIMTEYRRLSERLLNKLKRSFS